jgi:hypothetical protein
MRKNGYIYKGQWMNNVQDGEGVEEWPDGRRFKGNFANGKKDVSGEFFWKKSGASYKG